MSVTKSSLVIATAILLLCGTATAQPLQFDVTQGIAAGAPYPAAALEFEVVAGVPPEPVVPVEIVVLTLREVCVPPDPCTPVDFDLTATDTGGDVGLFGPEVNVGWATPPGDTIAPSGLSLDLLFEMDPHSAASPAPVMGINPCVIPSATGFDLQFETEIPGSGVAEHFAHFEVNSGQALDLSNIQVGALQGASFPLTFDLIPTGSVDPTEPLFTTTLSGTLGPSQAVPALTPAVLVALCFLLVASALVTIRELSRSGDLAS